MSPKTIPTGGPKKNETLTECGIRGCREETGVDVVDAGDAGIYIAPASGLLGARRWPAGSSRTAGGGTWAIKGAGGVPERVWSRGLSQGTSQYWGPAW
ncbi:hypothetical protein GCM10010191_48530 [Actinomadura vinacea]|uniref:Nudix hydrolase domain-containing protein n=1 Tax=Actinomadura vinacea TaxID=115336 RepID=A0ABP5WNL0_9ACTN